MRKLLALLVAKIANVLGTSSSSGNKRRPQGLMVNHPYRNERCHRIATF